MPKTITVYSKPSCVQCNQTKWWLNRAGTEYQTIDISLPENAETLATIKDLGYTGAPVTIVSSLTEDDVHWYGFNVGKLETHCAA